MMQAAGYGTYLVTDNMHQIKPSYDMHRGFDVFDFFRGQTTDNYKPTWTVPEDKVSQALLKGTSPAMTGQMRQYFANVAGSVGRRPTGSPPWSSTQAAEYLELLSEGGPFFLTVDSYDPHEPWDPPEKYVEMYDDGALQPQGAVLRDLRSAASYLLPRELGADEGALLGPEVTENGSLRL